MFPLIALPLNDVQIRPLLRHFLDNDNLHSVFEFTPLCALTLTEIVFEHTYNVNCGKPYLRPCWYFCPDYQQSLLNYAIVIFAVEFLLIYLNMH